MTTPSHQYLGHLARLIVKRTPEGQREVLTAIAARAGGTPAQCWAELIRPGGATGDYEFQSSVVAAVEAELGLRPSSRPPDR